MLKDRLNTYILIAHLLLVGLTSYPTLAGNLNSNIKQSYSSTDDKDAALTNKINPRKGFSEKERSHEESSVKSMGLMSLTMGKASVYGLVTDLSGKRTISGAHVVLTKSGEEHKRYQIETTQNGAFYFNALEPGDWCLTASAADMLAHTINIMLAADQNQHIDLTLEDLESVDILRVSGKRTLIHPENIGSTTNIGHHLIEEYRSGNSLRQLIESTPGIMNDSFGNVITRGEHNSINYELDGAYLPEAAGVLQQTQFVTPRSLQNMQVDIGGYQAQDGGGPLGAITRMRSLPIDSQPTLTIGEQIGAPLAGNIYYNCGTALSQNANSVLSKIRIGSSGAFTGTTIGNAPPVKQFRDNYRSDINTLTKVEFRASARDIISAKLGINHTWLRVPISELSHKAGVRQTLHDRQDFLMLSWKHKFSKWLDESNLHLINAIYSETYRSRNVFDPDPVFNSEQPLWSMQPNASRFNYIFSAQGDVSKVLFKSHYLKAGFLSEIRPVRTNFESYYYNNDPNNPDVPFGALINPFTGQVGGPNFTNNLGKIKGFRYLQSAFIQDSWRPQTGFLKRLTLDAGVRFDLYHGSFGNTLRVAQTLMSIPNQMPLLLQPFQNQSVTNAQISGRYGASFVIRKNMVLRGSYSDIFTPPPVDLFSTPPDLNAVFNGIANGTVRPMQAMRGKLADVSIEQQIGPRFAARTNLFYKRLNNFGDSGVVGNSLLYNRQTIAAQEAYGIETRMDFMGARNGYGFNGFLSNTVQWAFLRGSKQVTGGIYAFDSSPVLTKYPDHDRRMQTVAGLGYRSPYGWWVLADLQLLTGLQDQRDPEIYGPHPSRTPFLRLLNVSGGYKVPPKMKAKNKWIPDSFDVRIENLLNQRSATNLGSPFQGTRYLLPVRVLVGCSWQFGGNNVFRAKTLKPAQAGSQI